MTVDELLRDLEILPGGEALIRAFLVVLYLEYKKRGQDSEFDMLLQQELWTTRGKSAVTWLIKATVLLRVKGYIGMQDARRLRKTINTTCAEHEMKRVN